MNSWNEEVMVPVLGIGVASTAIACAMKLDASASERDEQYQAQHSRLRDAAEEAETTSRRINEILEAQQRRLQGQITTTYARSFEVRAAEYKKSAAMWLQATCGAAGLTVAFVLLNLLLLAPSNQGFDIGVSLAKILVFTTFVTATLWCGRMFKASRHNQAMNEQRAAALDSAMDFVNATSDESVRQAMLLHVAQAVFAHQSTGLVPEASDSAPQIVEFVRMFGAKQSAS